MIISKAAVLAIAAFCPSRAYDNSQQKSFDSLSSSNKSKRMNKEVTSAIRPRLTHYPFPSSEAETLSTTYTKVEVLTNKPKSHFVTSVVGERQEDDFFSTFEDQSVDDEVRAVSDKVDQELELVQHGQNDKYEAEDASVGILSFQYGIEKDKYHYVDEEEATHRRLDPTQCTDCCMGGCSTACEEAGGGNAGQATIGNGSCNGGSCNTVDPNLPKDEGLACHQVGFDGMATIGDEACTAKYSCSLVGSYQGDAIVDKESCTNEFSCFLAGSSGGKVTIGTGSCNYARSCSTIGFGIGAVVEVGDGSCTGEQSCIPDGFGGISFFIGNNSCTCEKCCYELRDGSYIGDNQCNSISDGCSNQDEPVLRPSSCADLNEYSCAFSLYIIGEDGGDKEDDGQKTVTVSTKTAICVKRTDTKKGKIEYRNECVSNEDILGLSSGSPLSSSKPNVEESIFSCGCCEPDAIPDDEEEEEEEEHSKKSYKNNKIKYADSDWCVSNNGEGGPLCTPEDETWDLCDEATTSTKSKKKLIRHRDLGKKSRKGKSAKNKKNDNKAYVNVCIRETVNGLETHSTECSDPFLDVRKAFGGKGGSESSAATVVASCGACTEDE